MAAARQHGRRGARMEPAKSCAGRPRPGADVLTAPGGALAPFARRRDVWPAGGTPAVTSAQRRGVRLAADPRAAVAGVSTLQTTERSTTGVDAVDLTI